MVKGSQYLLIPAIGLCISWSLYLELCWPRSGLQCPWTSQNWLITKVSVTKCHLQKKSLLMTHSWEAILTIQLFHHLLNFFKAFSTLENTVQYLEVPKKSKTQGKCLAQYKHSTNIQQTFQWMNLLNKKRWFGKYPKFISKTFINCAPTKVKKWQYSLVGLKARLPTLNPGSFPS